MRWTHSQEHTHSFYIERENEEIVPRHYNRFQMVLEERTDSKHQKKPVILWWGERTRKGSFASSITSPHSAVQENQQRLGIPSEAICLSNNQWWIDEWICNQRQCINFTLYPLPYCMFTLARIKSRVACSLCLKQPLLLVR